MKYTQLPDMVAESEYNKRMSICEPCENKRTVIKPDLMVCILCNCPILNTNKLKSSSCPINKW